MNEPELKVLATGFTLRKNPIDHFVTDLAMREGQLMQHFCSQVVGRHFPPHFIELYAIDMKQIPGLNMTVGEVRLPQISAGRLDTSRLLEADNERTDGRLR